LLAELEKARLLRARLDRGEACLGTQAALLDPAVMEIFGAAGFDWIAIDTEHAAHSPGTVRQMLQAAAHTAAVAVVRLLRLNEAEIGRFLDIGAAGLLCPFINTGDEARRLVAASRYPSLGTRSWGPRRAAGYGLEVGDYETLAHESLICLAMIETAEAVANIDEIAAVEGLTGVIVGPIDLSISLGAREDYNSDRYVEAVAAVRDACGAAGLPMGVGCASLEQAEKFIQAGDQLRLVGGDDLAIATAARTIVSELWSPEELRTTEPVGEL
jgi:2-keto-3-deoxy-L-rhamnonate aldolase RhmA